jgi:hypothetical protein
MSKLSEAMALMAGHEDSEGVAEFVLDTFRGRGKHDFGHGPMTVAEARATMQFGKQVSRSVTVPEFSGFRT